MSGDAASVVDLASRWLGGTVMAASDESFGDKENLLNPAEPAFEPGRYGNRGEIVDGWETRRRREPGHDWALIRLGAPGQIGSVVVDTRFFTGNHPAQCAVEACGREGYPSPEELNDPATDWVEIVPRSDLRGDALNTFAVADPRRFTHLRLSAFPDGGIARLRVFGGVVPDPRGLERMTIDLASQEFGGLVAASSDDFYAAAQTLNRPDHAKTMGEGWETRRRRDGGHDFVIIQLGFAGLVRRLIVDTAHFRYNASAAIAVYGCTRGGTPPATPPKPARLRAGTLPAHPPQPAGPPQPSRPRAGTRPTDSAQWNEILGRTRLQPDTRHVFDVRVPRAVTAVRLDAFPDGGLSRIRVIGTVDPAARRSAGCRWFDSLPASQAQDCLVAAGVPEHVADEVVRRRPSEAWLADQRTAPPGATRPRALIAMLEGEWHDSRGGDP